MFEAYFDDSGTDSNSDTAIAACYISTKRGWNDFTNQWDLARYEEDFDTFHMASFVAPREQNKEPWCRWDNARKDRVYRRLANIINENKRIGIAAAIPKKPFDEVPENLRSIFGKEHYTFAVRTCMERIRDWRERNSIRLPVQYIFDWEMTKSEKREEIENIFETMHESWTGFYGVDRGECSFRRKEDCKPLQAADILAWQMRSHMARIVSSPEKDVEMCHGGFLQLRADQEMDLGFYTEDAIRAWEVREWKNSQAPAR